MYFTALAALALPLLAHGLRAVPPETSVLLEGDEGREALLPGVEAFRSNWKEMAKGLSGEVNSTEGVKLVLGVFSPSHDVAYRNIIRETWMRQQGVCEGARGPVPDCSVYVVFAMGRPYSKADTNDTLGPDILPLPTKENKNSGKSFVFFREVVNRYPWATHYGKMDSDVFPYLDRIVESMQHTSPGCEAFLGKPWSCLGYMWCPPLNCGPPQGGNFRKYETTERGHCWSYMQGGLYILSRQLAEKAVNPFGWWVNHQVGIEDVTTGKAVDVAARFSGMCVDTWPQEMVVGNTSYYHARKGYPHVSNAWKVFYRA